MDEPFVSRSSACLSARSVLSRTNRAFCSIHHLLRNSCSAKIRSSSDNWLTGRILYVCSVKAFSDDHSFTIRDDSWRIQRERRTPQLNQQKRYGKYFLVSRSVSILFHQPHPGFACVSGRCPVMHLVIFGEISMDRIDDRA